MLRQSRQRSLVPAAPGFQQIRDLYRARVDGQTSLLAQKDITSMAAFAARFRLYQWKGNNLMNAKEIMMKRSFAKTFTVIAVIALALAIASTAYADDKGCSNATLQGTFAYTSSGSIASPPEIAGPFAEVGTQSFDGVGATTAAVTLSQDGNILPVTVTGTYTVNPDCTGTMILQVSPIAVTVHVLFVIDDSGNEFQAIETDDGLVITRIGRRLFTGRAI